MKNFNVTSMLVMLMFMCITSMQAQSIRCHAEAVDRRV